MTIQELIEALSALPAEVRLRQTARVWDLHLCEWTDVTGVSAYFEMSPPTLKNPVDIDINTTKSYE